MFSYFQSFQKMICIQFDAKTKFLRTNNSTKYMDCGFCVYLESDRIIYYTSCAYISEQNGFAETRGR